MDKGYRESGQISIVQPIGSSDHNTVIAGFDLPVSAVSEEYGTVSRQIRIIYDLN